MAKKENSEYWWQNCEYCEWRNYFTNTEYDEFENDISEGCVFDGECSDPVFRSGCMRTDYSECDTKLKIDWDLW
jgi:hypothetical protein